MHVAEAIGWEFDILVSEESGILTTQWS
jgi:hypothetical protein